MLYNHLNFLLMYMRPFILHEEILNCVFAATAAIHVEQQWVLLQWEFLWILVRGGATPRRVLANRCLS